ncbi:MAG: flagellar motor switch protein FliM [Syntrophales bacterium]|jgi:flagellar motor switch protein FliM|nr:flagellar motor switch protein FliM [Syntrophales bacterium]MDY0043111.1 flagellar motor switch protein FliM [Syntrophales bacterium]
MSQILSQHEVDALLKGISEGDVETAQERRTVRPEIEKAVSYDLTSHKKIVRERMPTLEITGEKFARLFRTTLSSMLRKVVGVNSAKIDMIKYEEFLRSLPFPTSMHIFKMEPLKGNMIFIVESQFIFTLVDLLFGGTGREIFKLEGRDFTLIENNIVKKVVLSALFDLEEAWRPITNTKISYKRAEANPQFAQIVSADDAVVVIPFDIEMEFATGRMTVCIPYSTLEPIRDKLQGGYQSDKLEADKELAIRITEELKRAEIQLSVELGTTELPGRDIMNLKKGDVILFDRYFNDDIDIYVEKQLKFKGQPGVYKGNQSVQIARIYSGTMTDTGEDLKNGSR